MIGFQHYGHDQLPTLRQTLIDVHTEAYADAMENPFNQRFSWFVDHWGGNPGFACVVAYDNREAVGFAYGAPAKAGNEWWSKHWAEAPHGGDTSTFHLSELMIRPRWRKHGLSMQIHEAIMTNRPEALASLTVDVTHPRVRKLYESWGYFKVGENQPFADSPIYGVMVKRLHSDQS
jgi:GNAT superfamily N-acetyltransferase